MTPKRQEFNFEMTLIYPCESDLYLWQKCILNFLGVMASWRFTLFFRRFLSSKWI